MRNLLYWNWLVEKVGFLNKDVFGELKKRILMRLHILLLAEVRPKPTVFL